MKSITFHHKLMMLLGVHFALLIWALVTQFSWLGLLIGYALGKICSLVGNECGMHRLWTHKSYSTTRARELLLHMFALPMLYGSPITYAGIHRQHHAHSDTDLDPHVTRPWWRAVFYMRNKNYNMQARFVSDLMRDPWHRWVHRNYTKLNVILLLVCLAAVGPVWTGYTLSMLVIYNFVGVGLVNVLGHRPEYGERRFSTADLSTNNRLLQIITWNEGLHNNHHANPGSYHYRTKPGDVDVPAWIIERFLMVKA